MLKDYIPQLLGTNAIGGVAGLGYKLINIPSVRKASERIYIDCKSFMMI